MLGSSLQQVCAGEAKADWPKTRYKVSTPTSVKRQAVLVIIAF